VSISRDGDIAVITVTNPPVNALSQEVRKGLWDAIEEAESSGSRAIVLHCAGRTWFAGADIREFGMPPAEPLLPQVLDRLRACKVPVISAIHGTALGGGLETALASALPHRASRRETPDCRKSAWESCRGRWHAAPTARWVSRRHWV
jgi:3-hydroxyacyl-CoA dehydrogenase